MTGGVTTALDAVSPPLLVPDRAGWVARGRRLAGSRAVWAMGDQAVLSAGNFFTGWLLARSLTRTAFGDYGVVLSLLLLANNLHTSVVAYPLSITAAAAADDAAVRRRTRRAVAMTLLLAVPFAAALAVPTARLLGWSAVPWVVLALTLWQVQETVRRALLSRFRYATAAVGDGVSYLGQAAVVALLVRGLFGGPTMTAVFAVVAVTSAAAAVLQAFQLRLFTTADPARGTLPDQVREHWDLGRWVLLGNVANVATVYAIPWVIHYWRGDEVAMYFVVLQVLNAGNPVLAGIAGLVTPAVAKATADRGLAAGRRVAVKYAATGLAFLLPFYAALLALPTFVLSHWYGSRSPYVGLGGPLRAYTVVYATTYVAAMIASYLCGLGRSKLPFYGQTANAVVSVLVTLPLAARYGVNGAAAGATVAVVVQLATNVYLVRRPLPN